MILRILFLIGILSLEAVLGLPWFFVYLSAAWSRKQARLTAVLSQFFWAFLLACFYAVSWPMLAASLLALQLLWHWLLGQKYLNHQVVFVITTVIWQIGFLFAIGLEWSIILPVHGILFGLYLWKSKLKDYAF